MYTVDHETYPISHHFVFDNLFMLGGEEPPMLFLARSQTFVESPSYESTLEGLPHSYEYDLDIRCYCGCDYRGPHHIKITDHKMSYHMYTRDDCPFYLFNDSIFTNVYLPLLSIDSLTAIVTRYQQSEDAIIHKLEYHPEYGFPQIFDVDAYPQYVDDELAFVISNFREL